MFFFGFFLSVPMFFKLFDSFPRFSLRLGRYKIGALQSTRFSTQVFLLALLDDCFLVCCLCVVAWFCLVFCAIVIF